MSHIYRGIDGRYHFVYITINLLNGKPYIGKRSTKRNNLDPWYLGSGNALKDAVKKYGKENFKRTIIKCFDTEVEVYKYEKLLINEEFIKLSNTYNMTIGGNGFSSGDSNPIYGKKLKPETRKKISESLTGQNHPQWGKQASPETKKKMSKARFGKKHTLETKKKLSDMNKGKKLSSEHKKKLSETRLKMSKKQCPHCQRWFKPSNYTQWHGDNCKLKQNTL